MSPLSRLRSPLLCGLLLSSAACTGYTPISDSEKSDTPEERCASAAVDDGDFCRASDGTFAPASCCELQSELEEFSCTFEEPIFVIDDSERLEDFVLDTQTVTLSDYEGLTEMRQRQLHAAAAHLSFLTGGEAAEELFGSSVTDEEEFILNDVLVDADIPFDGDWVKFFSGDTEVGVVFAFGTLDIVAEVSDGDIKKCVPVKAPSFTCTFDTPSFGVESSGELADFVNDRETIESDDFADLDDLKKRQLYAAAVHLSFLDGSEPPEALFVNDISDEEDYIYTELIIDGAEFFEGDWVKFFAGDTEVGVIFAAGTTDIVSEVSDGDLKACVQD